ncbi:MAG: redoxin domain-containing protein [Chitinophagaceae bacterium]|nr:redoxin domain-containing protein [Chitinophagaceae bacterium]
MENEEVLYMIDGKFKIEKKLTEPVLLSIRIRPEITGNFDPRTFESVFVWVDNKKMTLVGEKGNFEYCNVSGYSRQDENERMKNYVRNNLNDLSKRIDSLSQIQSESATAELNELKAISYVHFLNKYRLDYCLRNPDLFISVYEYSWFVKWLPEMVPKSYAAAFYNSLSDSLKNTTHGEQVKNYLDHIAVNSRLKTGDMAYDFSLPDSTGKIASLSDFKGKLVLLDFWAANCGPCRKEHKNYSAIYHEFKDAGFEIISVSQDRSKKTWQNAMDKDRMSWVSLRDEDMRVSTYLYLVSGIPNNYLISQDGIIIAINLRGAELNNYLKKLLKN